MTRQQDLKKYHACVDRTAVFTQKHQNKWEIFQIFVSFSEKLDFTWDFQNLHINFTIIFTLLY